MMLDNTPPWYSARCQVRLAAGRRERRIWANHGKPWDRKAMGTKVFRFRYAGYYVSPAAGNLAARLKGRYAKLGV